MPFISSLLRLTWDGRAPAPYESGASVFLKVMALNALTFREFYALICREAGSVPIFPRDLMNGAWIDFDRYSALLRVDQARLKQGFLDWLGIESSNGKAVGIRRCPDCTRLHYHCSLFNLAIVKSCPWHGSAISEPCYGCVEQIQTEGTPRYGWSLNSQCRCRNDLRCLFERPVTSRVSPELAVRIEGDCRRMIGWWATIRQRQPGAEQLLASIIRTGSFYFEPDEHRAVAFGFAQQIAPFPDPWTHEIPATPAKRVIYDGRHADSGGGPESVAVLKRELASVRRYVWKRFVKRHSACLKIILSMQEEERQSLDASWFCSVCVAYIAWLGPGAPAHYKIARPPASDPAAVSGSALLDSGRRADHLPSHAELALFSFVRGWAAIERRVLHQNLYVYHANDRIWPILLKKSVGR
jgi:hypothetical protein